MNANDKGALFDIAIGAVLMFVCVFAVVAVFEYLVR